MSHRGPLATDCFFLITDGGAIAVLVVLSCLVIVLVVLVLVLVLKYIWRRTHSDSVNLKDNTQNSESLTQENPLYRVAQSRK